MSLIKNIDEFKLKYDNTDEFIRDNKLSSDVLEYYINKYEANWWYISYYQTLSESFIDKYSDKVFWYGISKCQTLSNSFIIKYIDKVRWIGLFINKKITLCYEFILKYLYHFNLYVVSIKIKDNDNVTRLIKEFPDKYNIDKLAYEFNN